MRGRAGSGAATARGAVARGREGGGGKPQRRYVRVTRWRRATFFRVLEETGCVRMAVEAAGLGSRAVYRLKRIEPGFADRMAAAKAKASERLRALSRLPPGQAQAQDRRQETEGAEPPLVSVPLPAPGKGLVIRRGIGGRLRVMAAGNRWWDDRADAVFLGHLRATGNVRASARAAGFTPKSAYNRRERMPSFARAWDEALAEAEQRVEARAVAEAIRGTPAMYQGAYEIGEPGRQDPWLAIWLLQWWERKRLRRMRAAAGG